MPNVTEPSRPNNLSNSPFLCPHISSSACKMTPDVLPVSNERLHGKRKQSGWINPTTWRGAVGVAVASGLILAGVAEVSEHTSIGVYDSSIVIRWR